MTNYILQIGIIITKECKLLGGIDFDAAKEKAG